MAQFAVILLLGGTLGGLLLATGWWRFALVPFAIPARRMTVARLGLHVDDPRDVERVQAILGSFAEGFNRMIMRPSMRSWQAYCASLPALLRPFAHEGAAMGYTARRWFRYEPGEFEAQIVRPRPEFRYLYYVGLGFWSGMRGHDAKRVEAVAERLDPLHRFLVFDGYGFKHAFFDYSRDPGSLVRLDGLEGYARNAAYQGVGRAFYFRFMSRPEEMVEHVRRLGRHAMDAAQGLGLAAAFVNPDRMERALSLGRRIPAEWQAHFHLGLCFGLKARSINDVEQFDHDIASQPAAVQDAIRASVRECDRVELLVRADGAADGYHRWRERVTTWMTKNVEYPMARVLAGTAPVSERAPVGGLVPGGTPNDTATGDDNPYRHRQAAGTVRNDEGMKNHERL